MFSIPGPFYINNPSKAFSIDEDISASTFLKFKTQGRGPLTSSGFQATALLTSTIAQSNGEKDWPDIQLSLFGLSPHRLFSSDMANAFGIRESILHKYYSPAIGKPAFFITVSAARPYSRGDLCLTKRQHLQINPNYLSDPLGLDLLVMKEGIQRALHLAENTTIFQKLGTIYHSKSFPGCEKHWFRSDPYWECYLRHYSVSMNDFVGTTAMGAVIDSQFKVLGIKNLRVVDAGSIPVITGANAQAPTMMIAERAAHVIAHQWKSREQPSIVNNLNFPHPPIIATTSHPLEYQNGVLFEQDVPELVTPTPPPFSVQNFQHKYNDYTIFQQHDSPGQPGFSTEFRIPNPKDPFFTTQRPFEAGSERSQIQTWDNPVTIRDTTTAGRYENSELLNSKDESNRQGKSFPVSAVHVNSNELRSSTMGDSSSTTVTSQSGATVTPTSKYGNPRRRKKYRKRLTGVQINTRAQLGHRNVTRIRKPAKYLTNGTQEGNFELGTQQVFKHDVPRRYVIVRRRKKKRPKIVNNNTLDPDLVSIVANKSQNKLTGAEKSRNLFWQRYMGTRRKKVSESYRPKVVQKRKVSIEEYELSSSNDNVIVLMDVDIMKSSRESEGQIECNNGSRNNRTIGKLECENVLKMRQKGGNDSKMLKTHPIVPVDMNPEPKIMLPDFMETPSSISNSSNDDSDEMMMSMS